MISKLPDADDIALLRSVSDLDAHRLAQHLDQPLDADIRETLLTRLLAIAPVRRRSHRRPFLVVSLAATSVLATAAAGYASWLIEHPEQGTQVNCQLSSESWSQPDLDSEDPIAICAAEWRREAAQSVPRLAAYATDEGVVVRPEAWAVPVGYRRLPSGFRFDAAILELERTLSDQIHGLAATCLSAEDAKRQVQEQLRQAGLATWSVSQRGRPDGSSTCSTYYYLRSDKREVELGSEKAHEDAFTKQLQALPTCIDRDRARSEIDKAATSAGLAQDAYQISELDQVRSSCTRITMTIGGAYFVHLSGGAD